MQNNIASTGLYKVSIASLLALSLVGCNIFGGSSKNYTLPESIIMPQANIIPVALSKNADHDIFIAAIGNASEAKVLTYNNILEKSGSIWAYNFDTNSLREVHAGTEADKLIMPRDILFNTVTQTVFVCNALRNDTPTVEPYKHNLIEYVSLEGRFYKKRSWDIPKNSDSVYDFCGQLTQLSDGTVLLSNKVSKLSPSDTTNDPVAIYALYPLDSEAVIKPFINLSNITTESTDITQSSLGTTAISVDSEDNIYLYAQLTRINAQNPAKIYKIITKKSTAGLVADLEKTKQSTNKIEIKWPETTASDNSGTLAQSAQLNLETVETESQTNAPNLYPKTIYVMPEASAFYVLSSDADTPLAKACDLYKLTKDTSTSDTGTSKYVPTLVKRWAASSTKAVCYDMSLIKTTDDNLRAYVFAYGDIHASTPLQIDSITIQ